MNLGSNEQILKLIDEKNNILIMVDPIFNPDSFVSGLAFGLYLKKLGKNVSVYSENKFFFFNIDQKYNFLSGFELIKNVLDLKNKLTIAVLTNNVKAKELSYEPKNDRIEIYLTPEDNKSFTKNDVIISDDNGNFDLIITIGIENLKKSGKIYDENVDFFFNRSIINIDINTANERYGQINHIEPHYRSISELIFDIISFYKSELIDEAIATAILTGIIYKTKGFKIKDLSPNTMTAVSNLMDVGANREKIVNNLYKTKTVSGLKTWARILENSVIDEQSKIFYSTINENNEKIDFNELFDELLSGITTIEIALLFTKVDDITYIDLITNNLLDARIIAADFSPVGDKDSVRFAISSGDTERVTNIVIKKIREKIQ